MKHIRKEKYDKLSKLFEEYWTKECDDNLKKFCENYGKKAYDLISFNEFQEWIGKERYKEYARRNKEIKGKFWISAPTTYFSYRKIDQIISNIEQSATQLPRHGSGT